jgi:hypothetical protein
MVREKAEPGSPPSGKGESGGADSRRRPRTLRPRRDWLAQGLREIYQETLDDPIPDAFKELLDELERKEQTTAEDKPPGDRAQWSPSDEPPDDKGGRQDGGRE